MWSTLRRAIYIYIYRFPRVCARSGLQNNDAQHSCASELLASVNGLLCLYDLVLVLGHVGRSSHAWLPCTSLAKLVELLLSF